MGVTADQACGGEARQSERDCLRDQERSRAHRVMVLLIRLRVRNCRAHGEKIAGFQCNGGKKGPENIP